MRCEINGKEYKFCRKFQNDENRRHSLDLLSQKTFGGLSFERWYNQGYWNEKCIPYTLFDGDKAVANILVNTFKIVIQGEQKRYIQLGTVMTDCEYKNNGLSRFLMKKILEDWEEQCDAVYLYANDSVVNFYPKFGFIKESEYQYTMQVSPKNGNIRKLDISNDVDKRILIEKCKGTNPFSAIQMIDSYEFIMFHCITFMKDNIYFLEGFDAVVIAKQGNGTLFCFDVFCDEDISLNEILSVIADSNSSNVILGFTPKDPHNCKVAISEEKDTTLFVLKSKDNIFKKNKLMFQMLCRT